MCVQKLNEFQEGYQGQRIVKSVVPLGCVDDDVKWRKIPRWDDFTLAIPRVDRGKVLRYDRSGLHVGGFYVTSNDIN